MRHLIIFFFCWIVIYPCLAQKIKYKDLYVLLNSQRYEEAEPVLRTFLNDAKNEDHANAILQMGNIYQDKAVKADVLANNDHPLLYADSAIQYFETAIKYIDEKEIRKNDDYYTSYTRRDLRTGKIEIKLSDIHFDLKKRIEGLQQRKTDVKNLRDYYTNFTGFYEQAADGFRQIQAEYPHLKGLYLQADEEKLSVINSVGTAYDSSRSYYLRYRDLLDRQSDFGYDQKWLETELAEYPDADVSVDFSEDKINTPNIGLWASTTANIISKEIKPLKLHILEFDKALTDLAGKLYKDSVSVKSDVTNLAEKLLARQLEKYDPVMLPVQIFRLTMAELDYLSSLIEQKITRDSADVFYQLKSLNGLHRKVMKMDSLMNIISGIDVKEEAKNYRELIKKKYGSEHKLRESFSAKGIFIDQQKQAIDIHRRTAENALRYMVHGSDSLPLFYDTLAVTDFWPLQIVEEEYAIGLHMSGRQLKGAYFTDINPSRKSKIKVDIELDPNKFKPDQEATGSLSAANQAKSIFHVVIFQHDTIDTTNVHSIISKIYEADGLAWSKEFSWKEKPAGILYQDDTGDLIITFEGDGKATVTREGKIKPE